MTYFDKTKAEQITSLDGSILFAIVSLERANRAYDNRQWDWDITLPKEAKDDVNFSIIKDANGVGRIPFSAIIPLHNRRPFAAKNTIVSRVKSFTEYESTELDGITIESQQNGIDRPPIPEHITILEQYLVWLCLIANAYREYVQIYNSNLEITPDSITGMREKIIGGTLPNQSDVKSSISIATVGMDGQVGQGWEFLYQAPTSDDTAPEWYTLYRQNYDGSREIGAAIENPQTNAIGDNPVQTLEVCKDQDPNATEYGTTNGIKLWELITDGKS